MPNYNRNLFGDKRGETEHQLIPNKSLPALQAWMPMTHWKAWEETNFLTDEPLLKQLMHRSQHSMLHSHKPFLKNDRNILIFSCIFLLCVSRNIHTSPKQGFFGFGPPPPPPHPSPLEFPLESNGSGNYRNNFLIEQVIKVNM